MNFIFERLAIPEVILIKPRVFEDERGFFMETYKESEFKANGIDVSFVQDNHSLSRRKGVLRGLHYQMPPHAQAKLVRVPFGRIFDVAVDIRRGSPTFGKWVSAQLSADNRHQLFIPAGFAHGFCTLELDTEVIYKCSTEYLASCDRSVRWDDPDLNIDWPLALPILSPKDAAAPYLSQAEPVE